MRGKDARGFFCIIENLEPFYISVANQYMIVSAMQRCIKFKQQVAIVITIKYRFTCPDAGNQ